MEFQTLELIKFEEERIKRIIKENNEQFEKLIKTKNIKSILNDLVYLDKMIKASEKYLNDLTEYKQIQEEKLNNEQNTIQE